MRFTPTQLAGVAAVVLSLAVVGVAFRAHDRAALDAARTAAHDARVVLEHTNAHAAHADSVAASAKLRADSLVTVERDAATRADKASQSLSVLRERYRVASSVVPDTCRPITSAADSALAASDSVVASLHAALNAADDRAAVLSIGLDSTRDALSKLRAAATQSAFATAQFEHAAKPNILTRLLKVAMPRVGVGVAAGPDIHGQPNLVTGITVGWSF